MKAPEPRRDLRTVNGAPAGPVDPVSDVAVLFMALDEERTQSGAADPGRPLNQRGADHLGSIKTALRLLGQHPGGVHDGLAFQSTADPTTAQAARYRGRHRDEASVDQGSRG